MSSMDFPALDGRPVTEAHARVCGERGHAVHTVDGADTGTCPRCGEVTEQTPEQVYAAAFEQARAEGMDHYEAAELAARARGRTLS